MKNVISIFRISAYIAVFVITINPLFANSNEVKDKFEKTFKVSESDKLILNMYDSDLQINTWKSNEIKLAGEILISGGDKEDVEKVLNAFKDPKVDQGNGIIEISTVFSEGTIKILGFYEKTKLSTGESVSISSFKASYAIWIPEAIAFKLLSKYNTIKAASLTGSIDFQLYNVTLDMGDFGDKSVFNAKYSTVNAGKGKDVKFEIYDSKFNFDELNKVIINSKYSKVTSKSVNLLVLESYNDTYSIDNLKGIDIDAKYTTLTAKGNSNLGKFTLYNCNIFVENFAKIELESKYSEFNANNVGELSIKESYTDTYKLVSATTISCQDSKYSKFTIGKVGDLDFKASYTDTYQFDEINSYSCLDSKYNTVKMGFLKTSINLPESYDSSYKIDKVGVSFISFKGNFKYGSVMITADPALNYKLICNNTYGEINYPKERFKNKPLVYIEKDSKTQFESATDPNAKCEFNFTSYDMNFTIE